MSAETDGAVRTPDAMEKVRVGTVVRSASGTIACRYSSDLAVLFGDGRPVPWRVLTLPLVVLWDPKRGRPGDATWPGQQATP